MFGLTCGFPKGIPLPAIPFLPTQVDCALNTKYCTRLCAEYIRYSAGPASDRQGAAHA